LTHIQHEHADTMGIGKAIAVLTSGGDAQVRWGPELLFPRVCPFSVLLVLYNPSSVPPHNHPVRQTIIIPIVQTEN
uniref:Uncharacterized protein n=1 Tax=Sphenodon punctatus TaxID=8508 RepID=A0A8D0L3P9_SPHPU